MAVLTIKNMALSDNNQQFVSVSRFCISKKERTVRQTDRQTETERERANQKTKKLPRNAEYLGQRPNEHSNNENKQ